MLTLTGHKRAAPMGQALLGQVRHEQDRRDLLPDRRAKAELHEETMLGKREAREALNHPATRAAYLAAIEKLSPELAAKVKDAPTAHLVTLEKIARDLYKADETNELKRGNAELAAETKKLTAAQAAKVKEEARGLGEQRFNQSLVDKLQKDLDAAGSGVRSPFGQAASQIFRSKRILALLAKGQNELTPQEMRELGAAVASMMIGGVPTQHTIKEFTPKNVKLDAADIVQWLTSAPQAVEQKAWIDRILGTLHREEGAATDEIRKTQLERLGRHGQLFQRYPEGARSIIKRMKLDQQHPLGFVNPETFEVMPGGPVDVSGAKASGTGKKPTKVYDPVTGTLKDVP